MKTGSSELGENEHAGAGELLSVVVVKTPTINLVPPAWSAPWNVAKANWNGFNVIQIIHSAPANSRMER
jgi:hypothetical protein